VETEVVGRDAELAAIERSLKHDWAIDVT